MGWKSDERQRQVQFLNTLARSCEVECIRVNSSRAKVKTFFDSIRGSGASVDVQRQAANYYAAFEGTFRAPAHADAAAAAEAPAAAAPPRHQRALRGSSFLFTYNWDFFGHTLPDGRAPFPSQKALWREWKAWKKLVTAAMDVRKSTHTMEESLFSALPGRVHLHWKVNLGKAIHRSPAAFAFHGILPDVRPTALLEGSPRKARGASFNQASNHGHFYVWAPKVGTVKTGTNYEPFRDYRVHGKWVEDLWWDGKLTHEDYGALSTRARVGHANRKRDLAAVMLDEREAVVDKRIAEVTGPRKQS